MVEKIGAGSIMPAVCQMVLSNQLNEKLKISKAWDEVSETLNISETTSYMQPEKSVIKQRIRL